MKVVTPGLDTTLRTSVQLKEQVEIVSSSQSLDRRRSNEHPVIRANSFKSHFSAETAHQVSSAATILQRETVIDDVPLSRQSTRGGESPHLERINQSGWDSSQDEASNTPSTPSRVHKFSYLHPAGGPQLPVTQQYSPKKQKVSPPTIHKGSSTSLSSASTSESSQSAQNSISSASKSATLPPARAGFQVAHQQAGSAPSSEDEEESAFVKALKLGKEKLANSPVIRKRSSTMPPSMRNMAQCSHHAKRSPAESPVIGTKSSPSEKTSPTFKQPQTFRQPLAAALMRKIDSVSLDSEQVNNSSDEDDTFNKTPPARWKSMPGPKEKAPTPPAPKPKPQTRRAYTVDPRHHDTGLDNGSSHQPPFGSSADVHVEETREEKRNSDEENGSGLMNWKSVLRPVKRTESGRGSPAPPDIQQSRNDTSSGTLNQSPRNAPHPPSEPVANNSANFSMESDSLPPPLPANTISNRLSINFLDLPPPEEFMLVPGAETGETSTESPSLQRQSSRPSSGRVQQTPSPPPPPPDSSPPRELFGTSPLVGVKFPPLGRQTALPTFPQDDAPFKVPSPIPSPINAGSFENDTVAILPPKEFIPASELQGFRIPTPLGFEIPTPPNDDFGAGSNGSDLNEAIRQLQLLSEGLTTPPSVSKESSPQSKPRQDATSGKRKEAFPPPVVPEPVTVSDAPAYPPPSRSRSSTSSSNVSSLNR